MINLISLLTLVFFGIALLIQAYFWIFIFNQIENKNTTSVKKNEKKVSVVICALNEEKNLKKLIPAILNQKYENFELIIINDRSTDNTLQLLKSINNERFDFINIKRTPPGFDHKKYALQEGIKKASNDYILLTDADCLPNSPLWISEMTQGLTDKKQIALGISFYNRTKSLLNHFIQFETYYTALQYIGFAQAGHPYMGVGRNLLYKKTQFMNNIQFDSIKTHIGGDDDLLLQQFLTKSNVLTSINQNAQTSSIPKKTVESWFIQKTRHLSAGKKYPLNTKIQLGLLQLSHLVFYICIFCSFFQPQILVGTISAYLLRTIIIFSIFEAISKKFGNRLTKKEILFGDFAYAVYFFLTGIFTLYTKKLKWE